MTDQVVVGAAIVRDGWVLAARRSAPADVAGGWEFPGGKLEAGESERDALVRECREELGVGVAVGALLGASAIRPGLVLRLFWAELVDGEPEPLQDHDELRWLGPEALGAVPWLAADRLLVPALAQCLHPGTSPGSLR